MFVFRGVHWGILSGKVLGWTVGRMNFWRNGSNWRSWCCAFPIPTAESCWAFRENSKQCCHFSYKLQGQEGTWSIIQPCSRHSLCHTRFELQLCFCWWGRCTFVPQPWRWWDVRRKVCIQIDWLSSDFGCMVKHRKFIWVLTFRKLARFIEWKPKVRMACMQYAPKETTTIWDKILSNFWTRVTVLQQLGLSGLTY